MTDSATIHDQITNHRIQFHYSTGRNVCQYGTHLYYLSQKRNIADGLGKWVIMKFATGNFMQSETALAQPTLSEDLEKSFDFNVSQSFR